MQTHECIRLKTVTRTPTPLTFLQHWWLALFPRSLSLRACRLSFLPVLMSRSRYGFGCGPNPNLKEVKKVIDHIPSENGRNRVILLCQASYYCSFIPVQSVFSNSFKTWNPSRICASHHAKLQFWI